MIDSNDPRLTAYVLGELTESERLKVESKLAASDEHHDEVAKIRRTAESLEAYFASDINTSADNDCQAEAHSVELNVASLHRWQLVAAIVASSAVLLFIGAIVFARRASDVRDTATARSTTPNEPLGSRDPKTAAPAEDETHSMMLMVTPRIELGPEEEGQMLGAAYEQGSYQDATPHLDGFDATTTPGDYFAPGEATTAQSRFIPGRQSGMSGGMGMSSGMGSGAGGMAGMPNTVRGPGMPGDVSGGSGVSGEIGLGMPGMGAATEHGWIGRYEKYFDNLADGEGAGMGGSGMPGGMMGPGTGLRGMAPEHLWIGGNGAVASGQMPASEESENDESLRTQAYPVADLVLPILPILPGKQPEKPREAPRTWLRSKATPNASRLMIGDEDELPLEGMQANVVIDGFRARVLIDLYYYNDRQQRLEGSFQLRLPDEASPYYFAFGETSFEYRPQVDELASKGFFPTALVRESGQGLEQIRSLREASWSNVKEARVVPREKAAHAYGETVRRRIDPALVEWAGAGVFNARVFPLAPQKLHRIVIGYDVNLRAENGKLAFEMALPEHRGECSVDLNVAVLPGAKAEVSPPAQPFASSGRAFYHYTQPTTETISVELEAPGAIVLTGSAAAGDRAQAGDFFAARFTPDLPIAEKQSGSSRAIFLVDTSLSSQPDRFNFWLKLLETTLTENRDSLKEFAVLFFNIDSHWYKSAFTANTPEATEELLRYCHTLALEGATDIHQALAEAANPSWLGESKEVRSETPVDRFLFSDGAATWGETNSRLIAEASKSPLAGPLFAYRTGFAGTDGAALDSLARESGGAVFSVVNENEIPQAAVAHRQRPYKLVAVESAGGGDFLTAGRVRSIYPGQSLLLVGRGKPTGDIVLTLSRGEETLEVKTPIVHWLDSDLAARVYGQTAVGQLEDLQAAASDVATAYARHFRVTGQTCSLLMLDSEADYKRFQIKPEDDAFVVKSTPAAEHIDHTLDAAASRLADPKEMWLDWIERMANMPGGRFEASTALKVALEKLPAESFAVAPDRITCSTHTRQDAPKKYFEQLQAQQPNYETILAEAERRRGSGAADSLKVLSNLIETTPGDATLAKDVAFAAMELGLPGQAWPLLKRAAMLRPYEPLVYQAMAQCLADLGRADLAIVFYEIAVGGQWNDRSRDVQRIAAVDFLRLLRQVESKKVTAQAADYATARRASLEESVGLKEADLVVTMMWSTDRTDVDLHVIEPNGEECFYQHAQTQTGASITRDVTEGFGPEMYVAPKAVHGKYTVSANFYGDDANRTTARTKVYVTIVEGYGSPREKVTRKTVLLNRGQEKREVATVMVEK